MKNICVINGPSLNRLGKREVHIYGDKSYADLVQLIVDTANELEFNVEVMQSNHEGEIIDYIHESEEKFDGILINPAAYSHYSIAILDALLSVSIPSVEVHITNPFDRDAMRLNLITEKASVHMISGKGFDGYVEGLKYLLDFIDKRDESK
jgi:3-dehydroquinate dehydratase-2